MCCLEFWRKMLALYFNCWTILYLLENPICGTVGANKSFQTFMDLGRRSSLNMKLTKKNQQHRFLLKKMDTDALKLNILTQHYSIALLYFFSYFFWPCNSCVRGTRKQPLICVGCSFHYWVSCAINKGGFFEIAFSLSTHICLALRRLLTFCLTLTR